MHHIRTIRFEYNWVWRNDDAENAVYLEFFSDSGLTGIVAALDFFASRRHAKEAIIIGLLEVLLILG